MSHVTSATYTTERVSHIISIIVLKKKLLSYSTKLRSKEKDSVKCFTCCFNNNNNNNNNNNDDDDDDDNNKNNNNSNNNKYISNAANPSMTTHA